MGDLEALLQKVEAATGPDGMLDCHIAAELNLVPRTELILADGTSRWVPFWDKGIAPIVPAYTASIDAALALVERMLPGWRWYVDDRTAAVWEDGHYDESAIKGPTPALSLLAALLRALQHGGGK